MIILSKTIHGGVYDAGTDNGTTFKSPNQTTDPQQPISLFVDAPLGDGEALNATIATVTFTKL